MTVGFALYSSLLDIQPLMRLQRQMPLRMLQDVVDTLTSDILIASCVASITWLQTKIRRMAQPAERLRVMLSVENHLHLVNLLNHDGWGMFHKTALGRYRHPVGHPPMPRRPVRMARPLSG